MSLYIDLQAQHYLDSTYSVVSNTQGACDNYNLFTAEAAEIAGWAIWPQYDSFFKASEVAPGLIVRYPKRVGGGISQDELFGAATLSDVAAERIYEYGKKYWWYFNPDKTSFSLGNWFGRFLDLAPYIKMRAGKPLNIVEQLAWSIMTILSPLSPKSNTSGKLLKYVQLSKMQGKYPICDEAIHFWKQRMSKMYPGGLREVVGIYFGVEHPFYAYAKNNFL